MKAIKPSRLHCDPALYKLCARQYAEDEANRPIYSRPPYSDGEDR
ncbi:MAG TPA: hypothetical protein VI819_00295 [Patescibacteria group bacterium]|nr:hypothetical protein [Patescibacteria group bacterium]